MKLTIEFGIEVTEIQTTFTIDDELWIVMCYSALTVISSVDNQYYWILVNDKMKNKLENEA